MYSFLCTKTVGILVLSGT